MDNILKNWAKEMETANRPISNDRTWEKIARRIRSRKHSGRSFWDTKVLLIVLTLFAALLGGYIIIYLLKGDILLP